MFPPKPEKIPKVVEEAIRQWARRSPHETENHALAERVLASLRWEHIMGCYSFDWAGMFVGVELDGYIHT